MSRPLRILLAALLGTVLLLPATGVAAGWEDPPPPPEEIAPPPPPTSTEPTETVPTGPSSITIQVPPLPAKKATAPNAKPKPQATAAPARRTTPRRRTPVAERTTHTSVATAAEETQERKAAPKTKTKAKAKARKQQRARPQHRAVAKAVVPARPIRDQRQPASGVLAAQFTLGDESGTATIQRAALWVALALALLLGALVGVVGSAPILADRWPRVFVPVIDATERIVLAGICLAGAALTLVITWALTGPGA